MMERNNEWARIRLEESYQRYNKEEIERRHEIAKQEGTCDCRNCKEERGEEE